MGLDVSQGCERNQILSWSFYDWSLISSGCPRRLLKVSPKADVLIPTADDTGRLPASQLKRPFQGYSESLSKQLLRRHNAADTTTSLSILQPFLGPLRKSNLSTLLRRHQQLPFCTGDHFPAAATTTPALATTSLQKQLPVLHRRPPSCTSTTSSAPATISLQKQLPVLHRRPPSCSSYQFCTSSYQFCTSNRLPASAATSSAPATTCLEPATSPEPATTFLHQQIPAATSSAPATTSPEPATTSPEPATTSPEPATTFLHQQPLVLHQQLPVLNQRLPVLNQRPSSCPSGNHSCTSDHLSNEYQSCTSYPDLFQRRNPTPTITIQPQRLFAVRFSDLRFTIIKFGLSKQHPCFVILA